MPSLVLSGVIGLAGCTQATSSSGTPEVAPAGDGAVPAATAAPSDTSRASERQVVRTGTLSLRSPDLGATAEKLRQLAESMGGYVASESTWAGEGDAAATSRLVFSVPSANLDRFMAEAAKLGELVSRAVTARDVTEQVVDVEARIGTLRESIARIRALMSKAGSITEIARVEQELTQRQSELEALLAKQKALKNQVERAPVTVTLLRPGQAEDPNPFLIGLSQGWDALQNSIAVLLTLLGGVLPFALVGGAVAWPIVRRLRRRAAARKAGSADSDLRTSDATSASRPSSEPAGRQPEQPHHESGDQPEQDGTQPGSA